MYIPSPTTAFCAAVKPDIQRIASSAHICLRFNKESYQKQKRDVEKYLAEWINI
jgi:hypothetical protein